MITRTSQASWQGNMKAGKGAVEVGSGDLQGEYSAGSRFSNSRGTNPEEMIGAAEAECFTMALSHLLSEAGFEPKELSTKASVHLDNPDGEYKITSIDLRTEGSVPGIDNDQFKEIATRAKETCPVSKALTGVQISLEAALSGK